MKRIALLWVVSSVLIQAVAVEINALEVHATEAVPVTSRVLAVHSLNVQPAVANGLNAASMNADAAQMQQPISDAMKATAEMVTAINSASVEAHAETIASRDIVSLTAFVIQMHDYADFMEKSRNILAEFLTLTNPEAFLHMDRQDMDVLGEWLEAYKASTHVLTPTPPLRRGIRMISELRSTAFADSNLRYYAERGYDSVLITINSDDDTPEKLVALARMVRRHGMRPWVAWGGRDTFNLGIYRSLATIRRQFNAVMPFCEGFIPSWRRTSIHTVMHDEKYLTLLCSIAQEANPQIAIVDEVFRRHARNNTNYVAGSSGTYISGYGFQTYYPRHTARMFFADLLSMRPCLALVVGHSGQYGSKRNRHLTWKEALEAKEDVERQFMDVGCIGTITLHGDGYDIGTTLQSTDDIGQFPIEP